MQMLALMASYRMLNSTSSVLFLLLFQVPLLFTLSAHAQECSSIRTSSSGLTHTSFHVQGGSYGNGNGGYSYNVSWIWCAIISAFPHVVRFLAATSAWKFSTPCFTSQAGSLDVLCASHFAFLLCPKYHPPVCLAYSLCAHTRSASVPNALPTIWHAPCAHTRECSSIRTSSCISPKSHKHPPLYDPFAHIHERLSMHIITCFIDTLAHRVEATTMEATAPVTTKCCNEASKFCRVWDCRIAVRFRELWNVCNTCNRYPTRFPGLEF